MKQLYRRLSCFLALRTTLAHLLATTILVLCVAACSLNSSDGPVVRGVLPASLRASTHTADLQAQALTAAVTRVGAIRVVSGNMNVDAVVSVPVQPDGSFEVPVPARNPGNQLLITMNEQAETPLERSQGVIALASDFGVNLTGLPLENAPDDIDLGQLDFDPATRESLSSLSILEQSALFGLSPNELVDTILRTNSARSFVSRYSNHRPNGAGQFNFEQGITQGDPSTNFFDPAAIQDGGVNGWTDHRVWFEKSTFQILSFRMPAPDSDIDFERVSSGELTLILTPPYEVEYALGDATFSPENPIRYSGSGDWDAAQELGADFIVWEQDDGGGGLYLLFETFDEILPGVWILEIEGGRQLAIGDTGSFVTTAPDGTYLYYLPELRLDVDTDSGRIEQIRMRMFRYSAGADTYVLVNPDVWQDSVSWYGLQVVYGEQEDESVPYPSYWVSNDDIGPVHVPYIDLYMPPESGFPTPPDSGTVLRGLNFNYDINDIRFTHRYENSD